MVATDPPVSCCSAWATVLPRCSRHWAAAVDGQPLAQLPVLAEIVDQQNPAVKNAMDTLIVVIYVERTKPGN